MARHAPEKTKKNAAEHRKKLIKLADFDALRPDAIKYLRECQKSVKPCSYCTQGKDGQTFAAKLDKAGQCIQCHGEKVVPDHDLRQFANREVLERTDVKPKAVEMEISDKADVDEWADTIEKLGDDVINNLAKQLGVTFADESGQTGSSGQADGSEEPGSSPTL